jgi:hypothetical protein
MFEDGVGVGPCGRLSEPGGEALQEHAVDRVLLHPAEVPHDRIPAKRTEHLGGPDAPPRPVRIAAVRPVTRGVEPALVAAHDLAGEGFDVDRWAVGTDHGHEACRRDGEERK